MSIAERLIQQRAANISPLHPRDPALVQFFGSGANTAAGVSVTPEQAMRISAVYACVRILSSAFASLPLNIYRRLEGKGRELAADYPLFTILHDQPNRWQTSFEFREMQMVSLLLRGNSYSEIIATGGRAVSELIPLHPDRVLPFQAPDGTIAYKYQPLDGQFRIILQEEMYVLRGMSFDGIKGLSPIEYQRETVGLTMAAEQFGARYFGNGTVIGGVLEHPGELGDEAYERLKKSWAERHQGVANSNKPAILEEGMTWKALGVSPEESQFLETRQFQISEIARIFGVPPHMLADIEKTTSWGTGIEQQGIGFVVYSLNPWLVRAEQAIRRDLIPTSDKTTYFAEFLIDGLLRGDNKSRSEYYSKALGSGGSPAWMAQDEIRALENLNPWGGAAAEPPTITNTPTSDDDGDSDPDGDDGDGGGNGDDDTTRTLVQLHGDQFGKAMDRIVTCEVKGLQRAMNGADGDLVEFERRAAAFFDGHNGFIERHLDGLHDDPKQFARDHITETVRYLMAWLPKGAGEITRMLASWDAGRALQLTDEHASTALTGVDYGN